ncbi:efflux RND transporter periplasmic adaptor subunit [Lachnospiraceae bacterium NSJ-143]|nr:efflux RND transporter periplasmic adaptor subunit [Lachnospiraceae bacterium NSJ-143]
MKGRKKVIIIAAVAVIAAAAVVLAKGRGGKKAEAAPIPPSTVSVETGDIEQRVTASGTVQAADEHSIFIELSQEVEEVFAEVGDYVEEGQILVTYDIDDDRTELEDKVKSAQISLDNANLELSKIVDPAEGTELLELKSKVMSAQQSFDDAQKKLSDNAEDIADAREDLDYAGQMLDLGGISQSEYDSYEKTYNDLVKETSTLEDNLKSAELAFETAQLNLTNGQDRLNDPSTLNSYKKQLNTVETAKMNLKQAQDNLAKLTEASYSPVSGTVIESSAVEGQMLTDSTAIMKLADLTNLDVMAYVSEYDIAKIAVGQNVELMSDGIEDTVYHGTVTKIEPVAESKGTISGSETVVPVLVHMTDNDSLVKPGMEFDMEFITVSLENTDYIPVSAVMKDTKNNSYYVFAVNDSGILEKRTVEIGVSSDMYMQLISGIEKGDAIVESPDSNMEEGKSLMDYASAGAAGGSQKPDTEGSLLDGVMPGGGNSGGGAPGGGGPGGGMGGGPR